MKELCDRHEMQFLWARSAASRIRRAHDRNRVTSLDGLTRRVPLDALLVFFGLSPSSPHRRLGSRSGSQADRRRHREVRNQRARDLAVGDINLYPGKKKLILSGFHEAALAAFGPRDTSSRAQVHLQYTTTSRSCTRSSESSRQCSTEAAHSAGRSPAGQSGSGTRM